MTRAPVRLADTVVKIALRLRDHGCGGDAFESGAGLFDDQRQARDTSGPARRSPASHAAKAHSTHEAHSPPPARHAAACARRDRTHRRARPCGARCASRPVRPGPARPRYEGAALAHPARQRADHLSGQLLDDLVHAAGGCGVCPSTARNALVIATEILLASNFETVPLRRITCIGGAASGEADDWGAGGRMERWWLRDRERVTSRDPVMLLGLDVREDAAADARRKRRHKSAATAGTPRPWTFSWCRGRSPGSQVAVVPVSSQCDAASVTLRSENNSLLTVAGAAPDSRALLRDHRLPS